MNKREEIKRGFETAFIDYNISSNALYRPQFISNDYKEGRKVLSVIEDELDKCDSFCISVAFITMGGLVPLLQSLKDLEERGIHGKILTTDYLNFSDPKALRKLAEFSNIEVRMYCTNGEKEGFHTKGYIFKRDEIYQIIVGSSNITKSALTINKEWNTKIVSTQEGEYTRHINTEFNGLWNARETISFHNFIEDYSVRYEAIKEQRKIAKEQEVPSIAQYRLEPNDM